MTTTPARSLGLQLAAPDTAKQETPCSTSNVTSTTSVPSSQHIAAMVAGPPLSLAPQRPRRRHTRPALRPPRQLPELLSQGPAVAAVSLANGLHTAPLHHKYVADNVEGQEYGST
jgi:hypothetical protein